MRRDDQLPMKVGGGRVTHSINKRYKLEGKDSMVAGMDSSTHNPNVGRPQQRTFYRCLGSNPDPCPIARRIWFIISGSKHVEWAKLLFLTLSLQRRSPPLSIQQQSAGSDGHIHYPTTVTCSTTPRKSTTVFYLVPL